MNRDSAEFLGNLDQLLRSPAHIAKRCCEDSDLRPLVIACLSAIVSGGAIFGATLGSSRGLLQASLAGIKLPLAMLAALVVCAPAFHVFAAGLGRALPFRSVVALTLASAGRAGLVLLACAPALWLGMDTMLGYHQAVVVAALCYALAGAAALGVVWRGLGSGFRGLVTAAAFAGVLLPVGGQTAWMLRPFLGRPAKSEVPVLRSRESSFADAVVTSAFSAAGFFARRGDPRQYEPVDRYEQVEP